MLKYSKATVWFPHGQKIRQIAAVQNDFFMGHVEMRFPHGTVGRLIT